MCDDVMGSSYVDKAKSTPVSGLKKAYGTCSET
jgi:hypothetical protein